MLQCRSVLEDRVTSTCSCFKSGHVGLVSPTTVAAGCFDLLQIPRLREIHPSIHSFFQSFLHSFFIPVSSIMNVNKSLACQQSSAPACEACEIAYTICVCRPKRVRQCILRHSETPRPPSHPSLRTPNASNTLAYSEALSRLRPSRRSVQPPTRSRQAS